MTHTVDSLALDYTVWDNEYVFNYPRAEWKLETDNLLCTIDDTDHIL